MATGKNRSSVNTEVNTDPEDDDFFAGEETAHNQIPRVAIGDPTEAKEDTTTVVLMVLKGWYEATVVQIIDGRKRLLFQIRVPEPIKGENRVLLWNNAKIGEVLPTLVAGTKVKLVYEGKVGLSRGRTMKEIRVVYPANAERVPNRYLDVETPQD